MASSAGLAWDVSEYTLYGRFAQDVLGTNAGQFVSPSPLCHDYYKHVPLSAPELDSLLDGVGPGEVAVSLTAKAGMRPQQYVDVLERRWEGVRPREPADASEPVDRRGERSPAARLWPRDAATRSNFPSAPILTWAILAFVIILTLVLLQFGLD